MKFSEINIITRQEAVQMELAENELMEVVQTFQRRPPSKRLMEFPAGVFFVEEEDGRFVALEVVKKAQQKGQRAA